MSVFRAACDPSRLSCRVDVDGADRPVHLELSITLAGPLAPIDVKLALHGVQHRIDVAPIVEYAVRQTRQRYSRAVLLPGGGVRVTVEPQWHLLHSL